ncbi:hypothetical protein [Umezawaea sp. Da 62-37]|uniref:hypothetical protein n=1 Tax=Umezawaea sp. Da 62-37 TaxID=3075927 RepID=UPI0028F70441|nr:hypothetical protein [Umezawaea sp. Da 62-37]WNV87817.1 hypothetical protein RM788_05905 [Umezawaea sp. Da 62-37]
MDEGELGGSHVSVGRNGEAAGVLDADDHDAHPVQQADGLQRLPVGGRQAPAQGGQLCGVVGADADPGVVEDPVDDAPRGDHEVLQPATTGPSTVTRRPVGAPARLLDA